MPTLRDVVDLIHGWYPPATADSWDAVGLAAGEPDAEVGKVLLAVDPAPVVADEAAAWGADLLLTHHPLFLTAVHSGWPRPPRRAARWASLTGAGCGLLTAHTNADQAVAGVSESLVRSRSGLTDLAPTCPALWARRWTSSPSTSRSRGADDVRRALWPPPVPARSATTTMHVLQARGRAVPTARGRQPGDRRGRQPEVVAEVRIESVLPRAVVRPS